MVPTREGPHRDEDISQLLRGALGNTDFDYEALVSGAHQRAGRIRRRRAIATGAAVAVLGPALVGGAALVLPDLLPAGTQSPVVVAPAATTDTHTPSATPLTHDAVQTQSPAVQDPPWQESAPPMPEGGPEPENEDLPNAWTIPDARPTGVAALEELGAPQLWMNYPRVAPVMGMMVCDPPRVGGAEPVAGQSGDFFTDGADLQISYTVTGWQDSLAARDGLLEDGDLLCRWDLDPGEPQPFPGHEGDADYLVFSPEGSELSAAVVRQGDYLVAVTVQDDSTGGGAEDPGAQLAAEIAAKSAENLAALDPAHGRD